MYFLAKPSINLVRCLELAVTAAVCIWSGGRMTKSYRFRHWMIIILPFAELLCSLAECIQHLIWRSWGPGLNLAQAWVDQPSHSSSMEEKLAAILLWPQSKNGDIKLSYYTEREDMAEKSLDFGKASGIKPVTVVQFSPVGLVLQRTFCVAMVKW